MRWPPDALAPGRAGRLIFHFGPHHLDALHLLLHPAPLQAAIVDLDGTMIDTVGDFDVALNTMLDELGLPAVDQAFIARTVG